MGKGGPKVDGQHNGRTNMKKIVENIFHAWACATVPPTVPTPHLSPLISPTPNNWKIKKREREQGLHGVLNPYLHYCTKDQGQLEPKAKRRRLRLISKVCAMPISKKKSSVGCHPRTHRIQGGWTTPREAWDSRVLPMDDSRRERSRWTDWQAGTDKGEELSGNGVTPRKVVIFGALGKECSPKGQSRRQLGGVPHIPPDIYQNSTK